MVIIDINIKTVKINLSLDIFIVMYILSMKIIEQN